MIRPWQTSAIERPYVKKPFGSKPGGDNAAFYNSRQWRNFVKFYWLHHPRECVMCGKYANILDHIDPITNGGDRLDETNVQGLCYKCHNKKHKRHGK